MGLIGRPVVAAVSVILVAGVIVGCQQGAPVTQQTAIPISQQEQHVERAFTRQFHRQFDQGARPSRLRDIAQACRDEGIGESGEQIWTCEGWGLKPNGTCLITTVDLTTHSSGFVLEGRELEPGSGPFDPGSCKIAGEPMNPP